MPQDPRHSLTELAQRNYDLLVVGGGINGAGVAREAALRGLSVLLVDKADWGFGASSRSTKLVHGGLRYLERLETDLVGESLRERGQLLKTMAPHLVRPLPFLLPVYSGDARPGWKIRLGLWIYDFLAWRGNGLIKRHRWMDKTAALGLAPSLRQKGLQGAAVYWDAQMNDARLVLENVLDAERAGAKALNYCRLKSAHQLGDGDVRVRLRDEDAEIEVEVKARLMILAAGAWTDQALTLLGRNGPKPSLRPTKGVHLVTRRLVEGYAMLSSARSDGRVFFVIPIRLDGKDASLIGTTDTDFSGDKEHLRAEEDEVEYLLREAKALLPDADLKRQDIWSTYAGLRPLSAPGADDSHPGTVSREARLIESPGLLAVCGGKYTTYRALCQSLVERAAQRLGQTLPASTTATLPLPGAPRDAQEGQFLKHAAPKLAQQYSVSVATAQYLLDTYGRLTEDLLRMASERIEWKNPLAPGCECPAILGQVIWACRVEQARHLTDFYLRRTFLGLNLAPDHKGVERVAEAMAQELWWDQEREAEELDLLKRVVAGEYR